MVSVSSDPQRIYVASGTDFGGEVVRILGLPWALINSVTLKYEANKPVTVTVEQLVTHAQGEQLEAALRSRMSHFELKPAAAAAGD